MSEKTSNDNENIIIPINDFIRFHKLEYLDDVKAGLKTYIKWWLAIAGGLILVLGFFGFKIIVKSTFDDFTKKEVLKFQEEITKVKILSMEASEASDKAKNISLVAQKESEKAIEKIDILVADIEETGTRVSQRMSKLLTLEEKISKDFDSVSENILNLNKIDSTDLLEKIDYLNQIQSNSVIDQKSLSEIESRIVEIEQRMTTTVQESIPRIDRCRMIIKSNLRSNDNIIIDGVNLKKSTPYLFETIEGSRHEITIQSLDDESLIKTFNLICEFDLEPVRFVIKK